MGFNVPMHSAIAECCLLFFHVDQVLLGAARKRCCLRDVQPSTNDFFSPQPPLYSSSSAPATPVLFVVKKQKNVPQGDTFTRKGFCPFWAFATFHATSHASSQSLRSFSCILTKICRYFKNQAPLEVWIS